MGFGFVEFASEKGATTAMKRCGGACLIVCLHRFRTLALTLCACYRRLQGTMLDEHALQLRLSQRKADCT